MGFWVQVVFEKHAVSVEEDLEDGAAKAKVRETQPSVQAPRGHMCETFE